MNAADCFIPVNEYIYIDRFRPEDWIAMVQFLNDDEIHRNTLLHPYPYTREAAEGWIAQMRKADILKDQGGNLGIYFKGAGLIGGIGFAGWQDRKFRHQAEIGYWLGKPYRGNGYMGKIIRTFSDWIFEHSDYKKLTASTFVHNNISGHVLEKCGYQKEGILRHHMRKGNDYLDCVVYGLLKEERNNEK